MPRYFFHIRTECRMLWDRIGLDLPDFWGTPDAEIAEALWHEALDRKLRTRQILIITNESGKAVFVTAIGA
ncbi:hypothetical protein AAII07_52020 [Microvirga sp. 0TCS3.31]